ncbi:MAG: hypothetical protein CMQ09_05530 [Gammaproteobacteria bacterium]|jgi:cell division protein ZapB|nr:hypothetical protein [Gammaproteobacteria bacterium]
MTEDTEEKFDSLKEKVDDLIKVCSEMKLKNQILKASENNWQAERKQLLEKNKEAKSKLESILIRLKAMNNS